MPCRARLGTTFGGSRRRRRNGEVLKVTPGAQLMLPHTTPHTLERAHGVLRDSASRLARCTFAPTSGELAFRTLSFFLPVVEIALTIYSGYTLPLHFNISRL